MTDRPGLRRVIDKTFKISIGKEWLLALVSPSFVVVCFFCVTRYSLGIGIALAFINLILRISTHFIAPSPKER